MTALGKWGEDMEGILTKDENGTSLMIVSKTPGLRVLFFRSPRLRRSAARRHVLAKLHGARTRPTSEDTYMYYTCGDMDCALSVAGSKRVEARIRLPFGLSAQSKTRPLVPYIC